MLIVQLDDVPKLVPQLFVCEKLPLAVMPLMDSVPVPVFVSVTTWVFTVLRLLGVAKTTLFADRLTDGEPIARPVPERVIVCGLPVTLSLMVTAPARVPVVVGVNVTLIVQVEPTCSVMPVLPPQVSVSA
jgi:hypothetical protein